ncbi:helix-turn-helix domain-containing protein [Shinella sp. M27]|uniref:helix-turn-helix domain-containing protein n=1 Tax=Shinella sp. M27 TaxID=3368614 RepID=UPI003B9FA79F
MTQRKLAQMLDVDKAALNRRLTGATNLTLRSIADLAWALDADIEFSMRRKDASASRNYFVQREEKWQTSEREARSPSANNEISVPVVNRVQGTQKW